MGGFEPPSHLIESKLDWLHDRRLRVVPKKGVDVWRKDESIEGGKVV